MALLSSLPPASTTHHPTMEIFDLGDHGGPSTLGFLSRPCGHDSGASTLWIYRPLLFFWFEQRILLGGALLLGQFSSQY